MSKFKEFMNNEKLQIILKSVVLVLLFALFILGEYFRKHGGHPWFYWVLMAVVIAAGLVLILSGVYFKYRKKSGE